MSVPPPQADGEIPVPVYVIVLLIQVQPFAPSVGVRTVHDLVVASIKLSENVIVITKSKPVDKSRV
jgi:hypothetical protein